jgi:hypothetical protein
VSAAAIKALAAVEEEFGLDDEPLAAHPEDRARLYQSLLALSARATPAPTGLRRQDFVAAAIVFALVSATAISICRAAGGGHDVLDAR